MTNRLLASVAASLLFATFSATARAGLDVEPGMWEVTVKTEMAGMPMPIPPTTHRYCLTPKDLVPNDPPQPGQSCQVVDRKISGSKVTWRVECNNNGHKSSGTGEINYGRTRYEGHMTFHMNADGQAMDMNQTMEGHRIGACK
ncbi:MAG: DUF3617 family protein [Gammaproteobacteria bacterium]